MVIEEAIRVNEITDEEINHKMKPKLRKALSAIWTTLLVMAVLVALSITYIDIAYTAIYVDGQSMAPTLNSGFQNSKLVEFGLMNESGRAKRKLERGDIVVFDKNGNGKPELLIKRLIALPNETVLISNNASGDIVTVTTTSGEAIILTEDYLTETNKLNSAKPDKVGNGVSEALTLGANEYYLMGDNRANSHDSRDLGAISFTKIRGKLVVIQGYATKTQVDSESDGINTADDKPELEDRHYYSLREWRFY